MSGTVLELPIYKLDAFADRLFRGGPTAVCVPEAPLDDATMQAIATENNLAETAFIGRRGGGWWIRWFTPVCEVDLAGHPTLAAAAVVFAHYGTGTDHILFEGPLGPLPVEREGDFLRMDFPAVPPRPEATPAEIVDAVGTDPIATFRMDPVHRAEYRMLVYRDEARLRALTPRFEVLKRRRVNIIATAPRREGRFRESYLLPGRRRARGPGHRLRPLHDRTLLGGAARPQEAGRAPALVARARDPVRGERRPCPALRPLRPLPRGPHPDRGAAIDRSR